MTQLAALNVKITGDSADLQSDLSQAKTQLNSFEASAGKATKRTAGFSGSLGKLSNVSGQTRAQIQNTSFQLQDIAVQLQGGTKASTVFAQQLPQLLGGFGALGAVLGVVAGVGIPAVAFALSSLSDDVEGSEEAIDNFVGSLNTATNAFNFARRPVSDLREEFGDFADEIRDASMLAARAALSIGLDGLAGAVKEIEAPLANVQQKLAEYRQVVQNANTAQATLGERTELNAAAFDEQDDKVSNAISALSDAAAQIGMTSAEATKLSIELNKLSEAEAMEDVANQSAVVLGLFKDIFPETEKIPLEVANIVTELEAVLRAARAGANASAELKTELQGGRDAARELADEMAFIASLSPEVQARMVVSGVESGAIPPEALADLPQSDADKAMEKILERRRKLARQKEFDASGGQQADPLEGELDRLKDSLLTQEELELASHNRRQDILREALEKKYLDKVEFDALTEEEAARHNEAMEQLDRQRQQAALQGFSGMFGDLASLMQSSNDKLFKIGKAAAIAEAVVNGYSSAVSAWEKGMKIGGPPVAAAFAGASLAKTGALISSIKSTSSSGAGGGASGAVGGASATSGAVAAQTAPQTSNQVAISLTGGDMFSRDQVIQLINGINDAVDDGAQIRLV